MPDLKNRFQMMRQIPKILIYSRLAIGFLILWLGFIQSENYKTLAVSLFAVGLLTDIFDGIIARRLNVSNENLRRMDSNIDQVFFISVALSTFFFCPSFYNANKEAVFALLGIEGLTYFICFLKFKKEIATHTISSKIWTLILFGTLIELMMTCHSSLLFKTCIYVGILTRLEIIGIILLLPRWTNDVPGIYQAYLLRKGKPIKRHKLFNG